MMRVRRYDIEGADVWAELEELRNQNEDAVFLIVATLGSITEAVASGRSIEDCTGSYVYDQYNDTAPRLLIFSANGGTLYFICPADDGGPYGGDLVMLLAAPTGIRVQDRDIARERREKLRSKGYIR